MANREFSIYTSISFDPKTRAFKRNITINVDSKTGTVVSTEERDPSVFLHVRDGDIDLRHNIVMPGFVDAHTHIFLHSYQERPAQEQMRDESIIERTVRATNHVRRALLSGFTTYRDLGSEGLGAHDANFRDTINRGIIPGPRLFVATEALTSTGSYDFRTENGANGVTGPKLSDVCDGPVGVRQAVRRRVGQGADVIKFYADYRRKMMRFPPKQAHPYVGGMPFPPEDPNPAVVMFTQEEMSAIVEEANLAGLPVACHAGTCLGALMAAKAGVTSIEHGTETSDELLNVMKEKDIILVPTLAATEAIRKEQVPYAQEQVRKAFRAGIRFAVGGDTGVFNHGDGVREMELMIEAGLPIEEVLAACMLGGWDCCGREGSGYRFGWLEKGTRADVIALDTDPRVDTSAFRKVSFVMKDGQVWKSGGVPTGIIRRMMEESAPEGQPW